MKNIPSLLALVTSLAFAGTALAGEAQTELRTESGDSLVVSKMVSPQLLPPSFDRSVLKVRFSLDAQGRPQEVRVVSRTGEDVKQQVVKAFKEWRFDPAQLEKDALAKRYVLPLDVIPEA